MTTIAPLDWCTDATERAAAEPRYTTTLDQLRSRFATLHGSEKQIAWATTIREEIAATLADMLTKVEQFAVESDARLAGMRKRLNGVDWEAPSAAFWIGHRDETTALRDLIRNGSFHALASERWTEGY